MNALPATTGYSEVTPHGVRRPARAQYAFHSAGYWSASHVLNCAVVPDPSERTTGTILRAGSVRPGLSALIAGSLQMVIPPVKIRAMVSPDSRRFVTRWLPIFRLYMNDVPPATIGMYA